MGRTEEAQQEDGAGIAGKEMALEPTINVLGVREDDAWCAIALEMSLRGYGRTFEAALAALREAIEAQASFAGQQDSLDRIFMPAEPLRPNATFHSALAARPDPGGPLRLRLEVAPYPLPYSPATADGPRHGTCTLHPRGPTQPRVGNQATEARPLLSGKRRFWRIGGDRHTVG